MPDLEKAVLRLLLGPVHPCDGDVSRDVIRRGRLGLVIVNFDGHFAMVEPDLARLLVHRDLGGHEQLLGHLELGPPGRRTTFFHHDVGFLRVCCFPSAVQGRPLAANDPGSRSQDRLGF